MPHVNTVLHQLQQLLPMHEFDSFVGQHEADKWRKTFKTRDQLKIMMYAQATQKKSLRDIEIGLRVQDNVLYHLGIKTVGKSTLARANEAVPYEIFESLFYKLLEKCQNFSTGTASGFNFENKLYALDSTVIDLCLNLFPWAHFRKAKGAIKLHTLFNVKDQIPELIIESDGKTHDIEIARIIELEKLPKGSIIAMDRAYIDYSFLYDIQKHEYAFCCENKE